MVLYRLLEKSKEELKFAKNTLEYWGLESRFGNNLFQEYNQFAGSDLQRSSDLQQMIDNPDIKAIICARGGYGTVRILDLVDFLILKQTLNGLLDTAMLPPYTLLYTI